MHITDIKAFPVWIGTRNQMLVKVETNEGIYGWGESGLSTRELGVKGIIDHYKEWLIGRDPLKRGALWQEMYRSQYFEGGRTLTAAISSIDIALYDIVGKKLVVPVYDLLGGKHRNWVPTFATGNGNSSEEMIDSAKKMILEGFNCFRIHRAYEKELKEGIIIVPATSSGVAKDDVTIPDWVRNNAAWWAEGQIDDKAFANGLQYLIKEGIISV